MHNKKIFTQGLVCAVLAFSYIAAVATLLNNAQWLFGKVHNIFAPIGFLLLFVISAAVMGLLIFGKPVMLYLDGQKKEALRLLAHTIGFLSIIALIFFSILFILAH